MNLLVDRCQGIYIFRIAGPEGVELGTFGRGAGRVDGVVGGGCVEEDAGWFVAEGRAYKAED
jgi:hypothetical protein